MIPTFRSCKFIQRRKLDIYARAGCLNLSPSEMIDSRALQSVVVRRVRFRWPLFPKAIIQTFSWVQANCAGAPAWAVEMALALGIGDSTRTARKD